LPIIWNSSFLSCAENYRKWIVVGVLIGHLAILNYLGVKTGRRVSNVFFRDESCHAALFIAGGLIALALRPELRVPLHFTPTTAEGWFEALLLLVFGYGGFEGALIVGGESRSPKRTCRSRSGGAGATVFSLHGRRVCGGEHPSGRG